MTVLLTQDELVLQLSVHIPGLVSCKRPDVINLSKYGSLYNITIVSNNLYNIQINRMQFSGGKQMFNTSNVDLKNI